MDFSIEQFKDVACQMEYIKFGDGDKKLVIIPGLTVISITRTASLIYDANRLFAQNGFTVYAFDRRSDVSYPFSVADMAGDTLYVMKKLGLSNCFLYGHSQGGMISQHMLLKEPSIFRKAVLSSTVSRLNENAEKVFRNWIDKAAQHDARSLYESFIYYFVSDKFAEVIRKAFYEEADTVTDRELDEFIGHVRNMFEFNVKDSIGRIEAPTLIIGSKKDRVFDIALLQEVAAIKNCESYFYEDGGHCTSLEYPDFNQRLIDFFNKA